MSKLEEFAPIFYPKSMAVIGASADPLKFGGRFLQTTINFGYKGKLYPVNPQEPEILGLKAYPRVRDIPEPVDFATITIPAQAVPEVVEECLSSRVKAVQIISGGFREVGEEGRKLEERIARIAAKGIRVIGPNCFGVYSPGGGITVMPGENFPKESGPVAFFCQSGSYTHKVVDPSKGWGIRFSKIISFGNACDVNECDLLEYLKDDPETRVIAAYLEGVRNGRRFPKLLQEACKAKPVIIWKGGLTQGGARAVNSHTGSLGGQEAIWNGLFKQSGAVRVNSLEELIDNVLAFTILPPYKGRRVGSVGGGGAVTVAAADAYERAGLLALPFSAQLQKKLASVLPALYSSFKNPVDLGQPSPPPNIVKGALEAVLADDEVDIAVVDQIDLAGRGLSGPHWETVEKRRQELIQVAVDAKKKFGKPVVVVVPVQLTGADSIEIETERRKVCSYYHSRGIPTFLTLERAAKAMANVVNYYQRRDEVEHGS